MINHIRCLGSLQNMYFFPSKLTLHQPGCHLHWWQPTTGVEGDRPASNTKIWTASCSGWKYSLCNRWFWWWWTRLNLVVESFHRDLAISRRDGLSEILSCSCCCSIFDSIIWVFRNAFSISYKTNLSVLKWVIFVFITAVKSNVFCFLRAEMSQIEGKIV